MLANIPALSFAVEAPEFKSALIQQLNLQIELQFGTNLFTIGYVDSIGQRLPESINNINQPPTWIDGVSGSSWVGAIEALSADCHTD